MAKRQVQFSLNLGRYLSDQHKFQYLIGIDEAGRGPLAGPVVAACVGLQKEVEGIADSKKVSEYKRENLFCKIKDASFFSFGLVRENLIDKLNIYQATVLAFRKAINRLFQKYRILKRDNSIFIIDGNFVDLKMEVNYICLPHADATIKAVSAASILAKVLRDKIMYGYSQIFPLWGFSQHKGYPTFRHRQTIRQYGLSPIHRVSFKSSYESA